MANDVKTYVIFTPHENFKDKFEELKEFISEQIENEEEIFHRTYFEPEYEPYIDDNAICFQLNSAWNCPYGELIDLSYEYAANIKLVFADEFYDRFDCYKEQYADYDVFDEEFFDTFVGMNGATIGTVIADEDSVEGFYIDFKTFIPKSQEEYMLYYLVAWDVSTSDEDYKDYLEQFDFMEVEDDDSFFTAYDNDIDGFFDWLEDNYEE